MTELEASVPAAAEPPAPGDSPLPTNFNIDRINDVLLAGADKNLTNDEIGNDPADSSRTGPALFAAAPLAASRVARIHTERRGQISAKGPATSTCKAEANSATWEANSACKAVASACWEECPSPPPPSKVGEICPAKEERRAFREGLLAEKSIRKIVRDELTKNIHGGKLSKSIEALEEAKGDGKEEDAASIMLLQLVNGQSQGPQLYGRPVFSNQDSVFFDLISYAPGMTTSQADVQAVVEAEALPKAGSIPGKIDPDARRLIDAARNGGWQASKPAITRSCSMG